MSLNINYKPKITYERSLEDTEAERMISNFLEKRKKEDINQTIFDNLSKVQQSLPKKSKNTEK